MGSAENDLLMRDEYDTRYCPSCGCEDCRCDLEEALVASLIVTQTKQIRREEQIHNILLAVAAGFVCAALLLAILRWAGVL